MPEVGALVEDRCYRSGLIHRLHGEKIEEAALAAGFEQGREKEFVDTIVSNFKIWNGCG